MKRLIALLVVAAAVAPSPASATAACHRVYLAYDSTRYLLLCEQAKTSGVAVVEARATLSDCIPGSCAKLADAAVAATGVQEAYAPEARTGTIGPFPGICVLLRCTPQYVPTAGVHSEREAGQTTAVLLLFGIPVQLVSPVGYCASTVAECSAEPGTTGIGGILRAEP